MRKFLRKVTALIAAAVSLSAAAVFASGFADFGLDITASAEGECAHTRVTDYTCMDCGKEIVAEVMKSGGVCANFATVEEAVAEANNSADALRLRLVKDYTGDIVLNRADSTLIVTSSTSSVTITGDITAENLSSLSVANLTVNGNITSKGDGWLTINKVEGIDTVTANGNLTFENGSAETVNVYGTVDFTGGTVTDVNAYNNIVSIQAAAKITGTFTLNGENSNLLFMENITNPIKIKAKPGLVAYFGGSADPATFDFEKITSADGFKVVLDELDRILFVCEHSYTDGVCTKCKTECEHESYTDGVCDECEIKCKHPSYSSGICTVCDWHCSHNSCTDGVCNVCKEVCTHEAFTNGVCDICKSEFAAMVYSSNGGASWFKTVEEAVAKANSNGVVTKLYFIKDYEGDITLNCSGDIYFYSYGDAVTLTGNVTAENLNLLQVGNLTVNGSITTGENVILEIYDGVSVDKITAKGDSRLYGGTVKTADVYASMDLNGGTVTDVNLYSSQLSVYNKGNINGTVTFFGDESTYIKIPEQITNAIKIKAGVGKVAHLSLSVEDSDAVASLLISVDGYKTVIKENGEIRFVCSSHASYTNGVCDVCKEVCTHEAFTNGVCDVCKVDCAHDTLTNGVCDICKSEIAAKVSSVDGGRICFKTVEEAVAEANSNEAVVRLYFFKDYEGDITLNRSGTIVVGSSGNAVTLNGNITAENLKSLQVENLTVNGSITTGENVPLEIFDGVSVDTITAKYALQLYGGTVKTLNIYEQAVLRGGTVTDINLYSCGLYVYNKGNIKGTVTFLGDGSSIIHISEQITNAIKIKAGVGEVAEFYGSEVAGNAVASLLISVDGYKTVINDWSIRFVCEHTNKTTVWSSDASRHWHECNGCGIELDEANHTFVGSVCSVCDYKDASLKAEITSVTAGNASAIVKWDAVEGAEKYRVFYYLNGKYTAAANTTATSYTVKNLTNGTKYGFLVRAYINGGWTSYTTSDIVYTTPVDKPVVTAYAGNGRVRLDWTKVNGATKYAIYTYTNGEYELYKATTLNYYNVTGLNNGTKYGFLVKAYVNGKWTTYNTYDLAYATPVDKPVVTAYAGNGRVRLDWTKVNGATKYAIYTYTNGKYALYKATTLNYYNVTGLTNGTKYGFLVKAYVNGKWTAYNTYDLAYATPVDKPVITKTVAADGRVRLYWDKVEGATKYAIYTYSGGKYTLYKATTATAYSVSGLTNGTSYGFLVRAYVDGKWTTYNVYDRVTATPKK